MPLYSLLFSPHNPGETGLWIRIRINLGCWIRIRIQEGKNDPQI
jgi:hypothetical protein